jgi:hypothetical protein
MAVASPPKKKASTAMLRTNAYFFPLEVSTNSDTCGPHVAIPFCAVFFFAGSTWNHASVPKITTEIAAAIRKSTARFSNVGIVFYAERLQSDTEGRSPAVVCSALVRPVFFFKGQARVYVKAGKNSMYVINID